jgi:hypothetical protein
MQRGSGCNPIVERGDIITKILTNPYTPHQQLVDSARYTESSVENGEPKNKYCILVCVYFVLLTSMSEPSSSYRFLVIY